MELRDATPAQLAARRLKVAARQLARLGRWAVDPAFAAPPRVAPPDAPLVDTRRIAIARAGADPRLEAGKRHNVRLVAAALHGVAITPARPLSFWRAVGPPTAARGFAWGMELRSGCAVPAIGGGICLVTNAVFAIAVELGWQIVERHGHSLALGDPGALDATVAFPHVDLRIAPRDGVAVLDVAVRGDVLAIGVHHDAAPLRVELERRQRDDGAVRETWVRRRVFAGAALVDDAVIVDDRQRVPAALRTCLDCGETTCDARRELPASAAHLAHRRDAREGAAATPGRGR